jgi:hypothetical protein
VIAKILQVYFDNQDVINLIIDIIKQILSK